MNVALAGLDPMVCLVYLGDITVHSTDLGAHLERLIWLVERLRSTGLKLKMSNSDCQTAFETLKERFVSFPVLGLPNDEGEFVVDTHASEHAVGDVLSQSQDGDERVIAYYSKLYPRSESNYCTSRKELMAVVDT